MPKLEIKNPSDIEYMRKIFNPAYTSFLDFNPEKNIFISAMGYIDRIDLYTKSGEHIKEISGDEKFKAKYAEDVFRLKRENNKTKRIGNWYYRSPVTYKNFFTILYIGAEIEKAMRDSSLTTQMRFYNYKGELKSILTLNENLFYYTIDEKNGELYGVCQLTDKIYRYNIKHMLNEL